MAAAGVKWDSIPFVLANFRRSWIFADRIRTMDSTSSKLSSSS